MDKVYFYNKHDEKLSGVIHMPDKTPAPAVIISHGFGSSKTNKEAWARHLCNAGFLVLRFDFSGHGESEGRIEETTLTKVAADLNAAIDFVKCLRESKNKIGLTGHSLGGAASLLAADKADAVAAIAPPTDFSALYEFRTKRGLINIDEWKKRGHMDLFGIKVNYSLYADAIKHDAKSIAKPIKCPVLLIHGDKDDVVPLHQSEEFLDLLSCEKRLEIMRNEGHNFSAESYDRMINLTREWFLEQLF